MKFETQIKKLGIEKDVKSIIENCECGVVNYAYIEDLSKMRKWEIQEYIGNYLDADLYSDEFCLTGKRMSTFCKAFGIEENQIADYYALAINEGGVEIAYAITENLVLILEEREEGNLSFFLEESEEETTYITFDEMTDSERKAYNELSIEAQLDYDAKLLDQEVKAYVKEYNRLLKKYGHAETLTAEDVTSKPYFYGDESDTLTYSGGKNMAQYNGYNEGVWTADEVEMWEGA